MEYLANSLTDSDFGGLFGAKLVFSGEKSHDEVLHFRKSSVRLIKWIHEMFNFSQREFSAEKEEKEKKR
jgi:hypothetical protein